jgi:hypothetical protein
VRAGGRAAGGHHRGAVRYVNETRAKPSLPRAQLHLKALPRGAGVSRICGPKSKSPESNAK